jgi:hypothetical protein
MGRSSETALIETRRTMSREVIEVGAFTWSRIQRLYDGDPLPTIKKLMMHGPPTTLECSLESVKCCQARAPLDCMKQ